MEVLKGVNPGQQVVKVVNDELVKLLGGADVYRPAAIDQLHTLAKQIDVPAYPSTTDMNPVDICADAVEKAKEAGCDVLLLTRPAGCTSTRP